MRIIISTLSPNSLVEAFIGSKDEESKDDIFKIIIKKEFEFNVWMRLYVHEKGICNIKPKHKRAFFYKMYDTAKDFSDYQNICSSIERLTDRKSRKIDKLSYQIIQDRAEYFGHFEAVCWTALDISRRDMMTAENFMFKMYENSFSCPQYLSVADVYQAVIFKNARSHSFELGLAEAINKTAATFNNWLGLCEFSVRFDLGYHMLAYDRMMDSSESKTVKGLASIYKAINQSIYKNELSKNYAWVMKINRSILGAMMDLADCFEDWNLVRTMLWATVQYYEWAIGFIYASIINMLNCSDDSWTESDLRACCIFAASFKKYELLEELLCRYAKAFGDKTGVFDYVNRQAKELLNKSIKGEFYLV